MKEVYESKPALFLYIRVVINDKKYVLPSLDTFIQLLPAHKETLFC
jgi:hypothetical protein